MNLLAIDTTSVACSVALRAGDAQLARHEEQPREHTRLLIPMIDGLLTDAGISAADLDAVILGIGPGSFIGMRIGAAVAQGLAHAAGVSIVPVSSMATVAAAVLRDDADGPVMVAQDAHMSEVYLGAYAACNDHGVTVVLPERLQPLVAISELQQSSTVYRAAGEGWRRHPELLSANRPWLKSISPVQWPSAVETLRLGVYALAAGRCVAPAALQLTYLRHKVAEPARAMS